MNSKRRETAKREIAADSIFNGVVRTTVPDNLGWNAFAIAEYFISIKTSRWKRKSNAVCVTRARARRAER